MTVASSTDRIDISADNAASDPEAHDVVVVGGGQAGLATGYFLAREGLDFQILEANARVGDSWRNRWDTLRLFTPAKLSGLPGMEFPGSAYGFPSKDEVASYLETYADSMNIPVRTSTKVRRVGRKGDMWIVETQQEEIATRAVVIATGGYPTPKIPDWAADLDPEIMQLHSSMYRNPDQFLDGPVLVIGAAHSGVEIAIEAQRHHPTTLVGRDTGQMPLPTSGPLVPIAVPFIRFIMLNVLNVRTPIGRKARADFLNHGFPLEHPTRKDVLAAGVEWITGRATGTQDGKPALDDGRVLDPRNIVWCTGFHGDYSWIDGISYDESGYPAHTKGVVDDSPGLYFVGLKFQRTGASSLLLGVGPDAKGIVQHIARTIPARTQR